ncbi:MAG: serine/threonine-protein phosphatase [Myxococcales bacterium]|nr:MAG: serine/threonine-protein phosphatase [Myxococcales bacterium]
MSALKVSRSLTGWRRWRDKLVNEARRSDRIALGGLAAFATVLLVAGLVWPGTVPQVAMLLPIFLASMWVGPRSVPWFVIACLAGSCLLLAAQEEVTGRTVVRVIVTFALSAIIMVSALQRSRLGVSAPRSESMFVDLRDRITSHGTIPELGSGWGIESVWRSAEGTAFAGDFVVAASDPDTCDIVVVDVSGKGIDAGTRALLLSGAFGGILSAVRHEDFLAEANRYLLRQDWVEGFATAIHLHLNRHTGDFELRKAGHPPAVWLRAGSGGWRTMDSDGPILGLLDDGHHEALTGTLAHGDALMLYTDGVVETVGRDIGSGIDWLAGQGIRLFQTGFEGGARRVIDSLQNTDDDRALVIVHRH